MRLDHRIIQNVKRISVAQKLKERYSYQLRTSAKNTLKNSPNRTSPSHLMFSPIDSYKNGRVETQPTEAISKRDTQLSGMEQFFTPEETSATPKFNFSLKFNTINKSESKSRPQTAKATGTKTIEGSRVQSPRKTQLRKQSANRQA